MWCASQAYAKSKLTVQELAQQATDAAADYTGPARQAAQEVCLCIWDGWHTDRSQVTSIKSTWHARNVRLLTRPKF